MKPFIHWTGGKSKILKYLKIPKSYKDYYEPFVGSGAMLFHLNPLKSFISDKNERLIRCYRGIRDTPEKVIKMLDILKLKNSKDEYLKIREIFNKSEDLQNYEIASYFIYLNKRGFNGLYRENKKGDFNVPFGKNSNVELCSTSNILEISELLKSSRIQGCEYYQLTESCKPEDFVYFDPPYYGVFSQYTKFEFLEKEHLELFSEFKRLSDLGVYVLLSNSHNDKILELYKDYNIQIIQRPGTMNSDKNKRGKVSEIFVTNY